MKRRTEMNFKVGFARNRAGESQDDVRGQHSHGTGCTAAFRVTSETSSADGDGGETWIHILEKGEFSGDIELEGESLPGVTVVDEESLLSVTSRFVPGQPILIDYEHFSMDTEKSSEASGWGHELRRTADGNGLELRVEWTAEARQKIQGKIYRYISPVVSGRIRRAGDVVQLLCRSLRSAGLTNVPNMKSLRPVSANKNKTTNTIDMKHRLLLCSLVGCAAAVTDDELDSAVAKYQSDVAEAKNRAGRIPTLEAELKTFREERDTALVEKYKDVADADTVNEFLSANRDKAVKHFDGLLAKKGAEPKQPLYAKHRAQAPETSFETDAEGEAEANAKFRSVEARASERSRKEGIPFAKAFEEEKAKMGI